MTAASTTSLTVPPKALRIVFTSERPEDEWAQARCGPIVPSIDSGGAPVRFRA